MTKQSKSLRFSVKLLRDANFSLKKIQEITQKSSTFVSKWSKQTTFDSKKYPKFRKGSKINKEIFDFIIKEGSENWTDQGGSIRSISKKVLSKFNVRISHVAVHYHIKRNFKYLRTQPVKAFLDVKKKKIG